MRSKKEDGKLQHYYHNRWMRPR